VVVRFDITDTGLPNRRDVGLDGLVADHERRGALAVRPGERGVPADRVDSEATDEQLARGTRA
jgi:hypothetical protein